MTHIASRPVARGATRQSEVRRDARVLFPLDLVAPMTNRPRPYRSPGRLYCTRLPLREAFMRMGAPPAHGVFPRKREFRPNELDSGSRPE
jgi:hypothetical protein